MNEKVYYKVLLVDDNKRLGESLQPKAEQYGLDLRQVVCWADAKEQLDNRDDFERWSAIILDANCTFEKDAIPDLHFLDKVLQQLQGLFERYASQIPWFVLTAGGKGEFEWVKEGILSRERDKSWGDVFYFKDKPDENGKDQVEILFENIQRIAPLSENNKIRYQYKNVFDVLKEHFDKQDESIMLNLLIALHFPKNDFDPDLYFNKLRQIVESLFHAYNKLGLLPDAFFEDNKINMQEASRFLAGEEPKYIPFRYGKKEEKVFPKLIAEIVREIVNVTNLGSHKGQSDEQGSKEINSYIKEKMLFGCTLQLCGVIEWFGNDAKIHPDRIENMKKPVPLKITEDEREPAFYEGKIDVLKQDDNLNLYVGLCKIPFKHNDKIGKKIKLSEVTQNTKDGPDFRKKYPLIAFGIELVDE